MVLSYPFFESLVQVVCTTDAAPIYIERMRICMAEHMAMGDTFFCRLRNELDRKYAPSRIWRRSLHACVVHAAYM